MISINRCFVIAIVSVGLAASALAADEKKPPAKENQGLPLAFHEDFSSGEKALEKFHVDDPAAWAVVKDESAKQEVLALQKQSKYKPPVRSPVNRALIKDLWVGAFVMEVRVKSTPARGDYGHRDMCFFFGNVDDSHQFYVHLAKLADPNANNVFIVNGVDRKNIATRTTEGTEWGDAWHTVRIVRKESGEVEVFFDGKSIMTADRKEFPVGRLGVGSFDDEGRFASITVWGKKAEKPAKEG